MEMRISWSWSSLNIPMALQLGGWDTEEQECGAELEPGSSNHGTGWGERAQKGGGKLGNREGNEPFLFVLI